MRTADPTTYFEIHHTTAFRYRRPVGLLPHRLLLVPRNSLELKLLSFELHCTPEGRVDWSQDVFGNMVADVHFDTPSDHLEIESRVQVALSASPWPVLRIDPAAHKYPFAYLKDDATDIAALSLPRHMDPDGRLSRFAFGFIYGSLTDTLSLLKDINIGMLDFVQYRTRDEEGTQTPLETLALGSGSCRDIAALFLECVRTLGFGARAVSGYAFDPDVTHDNPGSTHAWAEVFLPGSGWVAFDPTQRQVGSHGLIATAVGRSNERVMPVTGSFAGDRNDFISMEAKATVLMVDG